MSSSVSFGRSTVVACSPRDESVQLADVSRAKRDTIGRQDTKDMLGLPVLLWLEPSPREKQRQDCMQHNCRPQERPDPFAANAEIQEDTPWQARCRSTSRKVRGMQTARPASDTQSDQGDAEHARYWDGNSGQFRSEQQPDYERRIHQQDKAGKGFACGGDCEQPVFHFKTPQCVESSKRPRPRRCCTARRARPMLALVWPCVE